MQLSKNHRFKQSVSVNKLNWCEHRNVLNTLSKHFNRIKSKEFLSFCYFKIKKKTLGKIFLY